jgi:hypothetical protein
MRSRVAPRCVPMVDAEPSAFLASRAPSAHCVTPISDTLEQHSAGSERVYTPVVGRKSSVLLD